MSTAGSIAGSLLLLFSRPRVERSFTRKTCKEVTIAAGNQRETRCLLSGTAVGMAVNVTQSLVLRRWQYQATRRCY